MLPALQIVLSSTLLISDEGPTAMGIEALLLAGTLWLGTTTLSLRTTPPAERRRGWQNLAFL